MKYEPNPNPIPRWPTVQNPKIFSLLTYKTKKTANGRIVSAHLRTDYFVKAAFVLKWCTSCRVSLMEYVWWCCTSHCYFLAVLMLTDIFLPSITIEKTSLQ